MAYKERLRPIGVPLYLFQSFAPPPRGLPLIWPKRVFAAEQGMVFRSLREVTAASWVLKRFAIVEPQIFPKYLAWTLDNESRNSILMTNWWCVASYWSAAKGFFSNFAFKEAEWPSDQRVELAIRRSRFQVPLWPLAGFVLGRPQLNPRPRL